MPSPIPRIIISLLFNSDFNKTDEKNGNDEEIKDEYTGKHELFVTGLNFDTDEVSLKSFFEPYRDITISKVLFGKA